METNKDEFVQDFVNRVFGAVAPLPRACSCKGVHVDDCPVIHFKKAAKQLGEAVYDRNKGS